MKYFIIAGEKSGDLHGAKVMEELIKLDKSAQFSYWGGDDMAMVAPGLKKHIRETAIMGFIEVARNIFKIQGFFKEVKQQIKLFRPDALILIDYPGFNLRIAKWAKEKLGLRIYYFISPTVWAWKPSRMKIVKKYIDEMMVILPFEKEFYKEHGIDVTYVGNPLVEYISQYEVNSNFLALHDVTKPILALLPGSRNQEVEKLLPLMLDAADAFHNDYDIVIAATNEVDKSLYPSDIKLVFNSTYDLLAHANLAIVTSGTATLETALYKVPQVVCYKTNRITYAIAKRLVNLKYISLVNLIMDKEVVKELIQDECTLGNIQNELHHLSGNKSAILCQYEELYTKLNAHTSSAKNVAEIIYNDF